MLSDVKLYSYFTTLTTLTADLEWHSRMLAFKNPYVLMLTFLSLSNFIVFSAQIYYVEICVR